MKVDELRNVIKKYNESDKEKIIVELYKRIPKNVKEDYNIDGYINTLNKKIEKGNTEITMERLEKEVNYFLECANSNLYVCPNRIIPKSERSKWRFKVKAFYKQLNSFLPTTEDGKKATKLLKELFKVLSVGTNSLTFSSWNTFGAIQVPQPEFLQVIIKRKLATGITKENLKYCVELLNVPYDPDEFHKSMLYTFISCLKTSDVRYMAIDLLKEQVEIWKAEYQKKTKYKDRTYINYFVECAVAIYFELAEIKEGITYFNKQYIETQNEVKEYILLEMLEDFELYNEWVAEYEKHIGKINYRERLKLKYNEYKNRK